LIYTLVAEGITILVTTHYMDEAEYCNQVGILNNGKLLALDTPAHLKETLPGRMWEIFVGGADQDRADLLLPVLDLMSSAPGVLRASLAGDHLRVMMNYEITQTYLYGTLSMGGFPDTRVESTQPVMEDMFMALVSR
jgi:ABC-2 type transport system ATP-binding protein